MANVNMIVLCLCVLPLCSLWVEAIDSGLIVKRHNQIRDMVRQGQVPGQPRGVNLVNMQWDVRLSQLAQVLANKCIFKHEIPKDPRWSVGQNLYVSGSSTKARNENWVDAMTSWYNEYKVYKFSNKFNAAAAHYTQLVWHNTQYVGCGYAYCPNSPKYQNYYVCNYGPAGNVMGQYPYKAV